MDLNVRAFRTVHAALAEIPAPKKTSESAREAGKRGGRARSEALTEERRREIAVNANKARWKQKEGK
jgi:hypothetical protein